MAPRIMFLKKKKNTSSVLFMHLKNHREISYLEKNSATQIEIKHWKYLNYVFIGWVGVLLKIDPEI